MICSERWLLTFITFVLIPTVTISTRIFTTLEQTKNVLPTIPSVFHGMTCNSDRHYSFRYLRTIVKAKAKGMSEDMFFPHPFDIYEYTARGPYYIYPLLFNSRIYETGTLHIDFMVLNADGIIMGGVVLEIEKYRKELKYYPCLPWDEKYQSLPESLFERRLVEDLAKYES
ncbi:unnamed protein product [Blumeria hordei]|uniref:Uncharacterized protein n=1 Tax=Blumeria hordei TaxID=2867405 RepID=A0A383UPQ0_BLUHO|nr:unnamed protein product [Blumeria hordei]